MWDRLGRIMQVRRITIIIIQIKLQTKAAPSKVLRLFYRTAIDGTNTFMLT